jgi:glycosyltransferase involved in cell wall biosynthesis
MNSLDRESKSMRVLHLIGSTGFYGAEAVVATLARTLPALGVETCVGHMRYAAARRSFRLEEHVDGCEVIPLEHERRMDFGFVVRLRAEMKRLGIDAIHSHGYKPDVYGGVAAKMAGLPMLSTCHLWTRATWALRGYARIDALMLRRFDKVVAVSQPILDELQKAGIASEKLALIPNQISAERFGAGKPEFRSIFGKDAFIFGAACRQVSAKGVDVLLRAAKVVTESLPEARFLIAGDGPKAEEYHELARNLGVGGKVRFLGRCGTMPNFYASLDVFVLPSLDEGMPIALLEAMAEGRPVIATKVGSVERVVRNELFGRLIAPGDSAALASAMLELASGQENLSQLGEAARNEVLAHHSGQRMALQYATLYREMSR